MDYQKTQLGVQLFQLLVLVFMLDVLVDIKRRL